MSKKKAASLTNKRRDYEAFLKSVRLISIGLEEISAKVDRDKYWAGRSSKDDGFVREIGTDFKATEVEKDHFDVAARMDLTIAGKESDEPIIAIQCAYYAHFHASTDCDEEVAERFAKSEAKIIIWPYFRQTVSDVTGRMHIPPITIPLALD